MATDKLQNIWKNIDSEITLKTIDELAQTLAARTRQTINKFLAFLIIDTIVCVGVIVFLIMTSFNRQYDTLYLINNGIICLITIISMVVSIVEWNKLHNNKYNLPLKEWVEERIRLLSKWLLGKHNKFYIILLPFLLMMINMSIHVYYEYKTFLEVLRDKESVYALIVGFVVGLTVSFIVVKKIRDYQIKNLDSLKELHARLCNESL
jgi:undecaprenyl pyrophosphate phosphatase UppP